MESQFIRYLPRIVLDRLLDKQHYTQKNSKKHERRVAYTSYLPSDCESEKLENASLVIADVTGFTKLNEKLSAQDDGVEKVTHHLNRYFTILLDIIDKHGGDVVKFAGDALIILFYHRKEVKEVEGQQREESVPTGLTLDKNTLKDLQNKTREMPLRAIQCALELQDKGRTYEVEGVCLSLHIAVAAGDVWTMHVGGEDREWEFLLAGQPFSQLERSLELSKTGEVVVPRPTWQMIADCCQGTPVPIVKTGEVKIISVNTKDKLLPISIPLPTDIQNKMKDKHLFSAVRSYVSRCVAQKLDAGQSKWLGELRTASVVFVNLRGLILNQNVDNKNHLPVRRTHIILVAMQKIISKNEGYRRQFLVDDKGTILIVVFGVSPFSHEDNEYRAVKTALQIRGMLIKKKIAHGIGIATGDIYVGSVGSSSRQEHAVVGDTVNSSARLSGKARDTVILCDERTTNAVRHSIRMRPHGEIYVKGKEKRIEIFEPLGVDPLSVSSRQAITGVQTVGRGIEMEKLMKALSSLKNGERGQRIFVEGDPGIGKTQILANFFRVSQANKDMKTFYVAADPTEQHVFLSLCTRLLERIFELMHTSGLFDHTDTPRSSRRELSPVIQTPTHNNSNNNIRNSTLDSLSEEEFKENSMTLNNNYDHNITLDQSLSQLRQRTLKVVNALNRAITTIAGASINLLGTGSEGDLLPRLPLLNPVLGINIPQNRLTDALSQKDEESLQDETVTGVLEVILLLCQASRAMGCAYVFIVEDLQLADAGSLSALHQIAGKASPLLLLLSARPIQVSHNEPTSPTSVSMDSITREHKVVEEEVAWVEWNKNFQAIEEMEVIALGGLDRKASTQLVYQTLQERHLVQQKKKEKEEKENRGAFEDEDPSPHMNTVVPEFSLQWVVYQGWLFKRPHRSSRFLWRKRYFVLYKDRLEWYKQKMKRTGSISRPLHTLGISKQAVVQVADDKRKRSFWLTAVQGDKTMTYDLMAPDEKHRDNWIKMIQQCIKNESIEEKKADIEESKLLDEKESDDENFGRESSIVGSGSRPEDSITKSSLDHGLILSGYVYKRGSNGWQRRYFLLFQEVLFYKQYENDAKLLGAIPKNSFHSIKSVDGLQFTLFINYTKNLYEMKLMTHKKELTEKWLSIIETTFVEKEKDKENKGDQKITSPNVEKGKYWKKADKALSSCSSKTIEYLTSIKRRNRSHTESMILFLNSPSTAIGRNRANSSETKKKFPRSLKEGYLEKRDSSKRGLWRRRYFVLFEDGLRYFKNYHDKQPSGVIALSVGIHPSNEQCEGRLYCISLQSSEVARKYIFSVETAIERDDWIKTLLSITAPESKEISQPYVAPSLPSPTNSSSSTSPFTTNSSTVSTTTNTSTAPVTNSKSNGVTVTTTSNYESADEFSFSSPSSSPSTSPYQSRKSSEATSPPSFTDIKFDTQFFPPGSHPIAEPLEPLSPSRSPSPSSPTPTPMTYTFPLLTSSTYPPTTTTTTTKPMERARPTNITTSLSSSSSSSSSGLPTSSSSLPTSSSGLPTSSSNLPTSSSNLPTSSSNLPTSSSGLPTSSSGLPASSSTSSNSPLPISQTFPPPTTFLVPASSFTLSPTLPTIQASPGTSPVSSPSPSPRSPIGVTDPMKSEKVHPTIMDLIMKHCQGNPLFTVEVSRNLYDRGYVVQQPIVESGRSSRAMVWVQHPDKQIAKINLSSSLKTFFTAIIDELTPTQALLCKLASIFGGEFKLKHLLALAKQEFEKISDHDIAVALRVLQSKRIMDRTDFADDEQEKQEEDDDDTNNNTIDSNQSQISNEAIADSSATSATSSLSSSSSAPSPTPSIKTNTIFTPPSTTTTIPLTPTTPTSLSSSVSSTSSSNLTLTPPRFNHDKKDNNTPDKKDTTTDKKDTTTDKKDNNKIVKKEQPQQKEKEEKSSNKNNLKVHSATTYIDGETLYFFVHDLVRGACYESVPFVQRQALHRKILGLLEEDLAEPPMDPPDELPPSLTDTTLTATSNSGNNSDLEGSSSQRSNLGNSGLSNSNSGGDTNSSIDGSSSSSLPINNNSSSKRNSLIDEDSFAPLVVSRERGLSGAINSLVYHLGKSGNISPTTTIIPSTDILLPSSSQAETTTTTTTTTTHEPDSPGSGNGNLDDSSHSIKRSSLYVTPINNTTIPSLASPSVSISISTATPSHKRLESVSEFKNNQLLTDRMKIKRVSLAYGCLSRRGGVIHPGGGHRKNIPSVAILRPSTSLSSLISDEHLVRKYSEDGDHSPSPLLSASGSFSDPSSSSTSTSTFLHVGVSLTPSSSISEKPKGILSE